MSRRPISPGYDLGARAPRDTLRDQLRDAMSRWASGVGVLAVREEDDVLAVTVTSIASLSLDPPLVMVSVGEQAGILPALLEVGRFTLNALAEGDRAAAIRFADSCPTGRDLVPPEGDPLLAGALWSLVCTRWADYPGGDHRILVGKVERVEIGAASAPLLYYRREYGGLKL